MARDITGGVNASFPYTFPFDFYIALSGKTVNTTTGRAVATATGRIINTVTGRTVNTATARTVQSG